MFELEAEIEVEGHGQVQSWGAGGIATTTARITRIKRMRMNPAVWSSITVWGVVSLGGVRGPPHFARGVGHDVLNL